MRPPSAMRSSVSPTVSKRNASASAVRSAAGSGAIDAASVVPPAAQNASRDLPRAIGRLALGDDPCLQLGRGHAREAGALVVGHGVDASAARSATGHRRADEPSAARADTPARASACRRPAGPARTAGPRPRSRAHRRSSVPGAWSAAGPTDAARMAMRPSTVSRNVPGHGAFARTWRSSSPRAGRDPVGRPRGGTAASWSRRPRPAARPGFAPDATPRAVRPSSSAPRRAAVASSSGAVSFPRSGQASWATIGPVSMPASIRMIVTPADRVAGEDRRRDRRRAPVTRQQRWMDVEDAARRQVRGSGAARSGRSRRGPRAPVGGRRSRRRPPGRGSARAAGSASRAPPHGPRPGSASARRPAPWVDPAS